MENIKLIALDLDGTLTQHRTSLSKAHREQLEKLSEKYKLLMVGAGQAMRIFNQMEQFPIDIIGNYGMQEGVYNKETGALDIIRDDTARQDKELLKSRVEALRERFGFLDFSGESIEFHPSGCVTFPILGTRAKIEDKLSFDPDRKKRRAIYSEVAAAFPEYNVFVGGSSSFDMAPKPFDKYFALSLYCQKAELKHSEVVFIGDDYGIGGNDESVYRSDFNFLKIDDYLDFPKITEPLL